MRKTVYWIEGDGIGADMFEELKFAYFKHRDAGGALWPGSFARFLGNGNTVLATVKLG